jgi:tetratricopeptide (TPR) repeat protein
MAYIARLDIDTLARARERTPQLTRESLALAKTLPASLAKAEVLANLLWPIEADDPATAQTMYLESRAIYQAADAHWHVANLDAAWAFACAASDQDRARQLYQSSLDFFAACGDRISAGECLGGLAQLQVQAGNTDEALRLWRERLAITQETHNQWAELMMWAVLGRQATRLGHYAEAKSDHRQSLSIVQPLGHLRMTADQFIDLARAEVLSGELAQAEQHLMQSLKILARVDDPTGPVEAYSLLGDIALTRGDPLQAQRHYQSALDSAAALPPEDYAQPTCRAVALTNFGKVSLVLGQSAQAHDFLHEAVQLISQIPPHWQTDALDTLMVVAQLMLQKQPLTAIALFTFVGAQPLAFQHMREEARQVLNELADRLQSAEVAVAQQHGQTLTLEEAIALAQACLKFSSASDRV